MTSLPTNTSGFGEVGAVVGHDRDEVGVPRLHRPALRGQVEGVGLGVEPSSPAGSIGPAATDVSLVPRSAFPARATPATPTPAISASAKAPSPTRKRRRERARRASRARARSSRGSGAGSGLGQGVAERALHAVLVVHQPHLPISPASVMSRSTPSRASLRWASARAFCDFTVPGEQPSSRAVWSTSRSCQCRSTTTARWRGPRVASAARIVRRRSTSGSSLAATAGGDLAGRSPGAGVLGASRR